MKFVLKVGKEGDFEKCLETLDDKKRMSPLPALLPRQVPSRFQMINIWWDVIAVRKKVREIEFSYFWNTSLNSLPFFASKMEKEVPKWVSALFMEAEKKEGWPKGTLSVVPVL
jgi:hypothetical protein